MTAPIACTGQITFIDATTVSCAGDWTVYESDILEFASLLEFSPSLFGILITACAVAFVTGHTVGHVARNLTRL